jgi:allantoicase
LDIIKCAEAGKVNNIQIDTHHFKETIQIDVLYKLLFINYKISEKNIVKKSKKWNLLLNKVKLRAHKKHNFKLN